MVLLIIKISESMVMLVLVLIVCAKLCISHASFLLHNGLTTLDSHDFGFTMDAEFIGIITIKE